MNYFAYKDKPEMKTKTSLVVKYVNKLAVDHEY